MARASEAFALAAAVFAIGLWPTSVEAHPLCWNELRPPDFETTNPFCGPQADGVCCNTVEEAAIEAQYNLLSLSPACAPLWKEVMCARCNSYSAHLYELLGDELPYPDGLTMSSDFCDSVVSACGGDIAFPIYGGGSKSYCEKHVGSSGDQFWSYPYTPVEIPPPGGMTALFDEEMYTSGKLPPDSIVMQMSPDGSVWWIGGQSGFLVSVGTDSLDDSTAVMDLSDSADFYLGFEEGFLGFAYGPRFGIGGNSRFYVSYSVNIGGDILNRLSKFDFVSGSPANTLGSEEVLVQSSPRSSTIHAGGWCGFKPSAYGSGGGSHELYWSAGDSGPQTDPENHGQDTSDLHSTMVRILVPTTGTGYTIPSGNVVGDGALPEICAYGFRNPFKCSFDRETDKLYCGDVGHTKVESIYEVECDKNYGWGKFEGSRCQEAREDLHGPCDGTDRSNYEFPMYEFCHPGYFSDTPEEQALTDGQDICGTRSVVGNAVIGGYIYRGTYFSEILGGAYVFGDTDPQNKLYYLKETDGVWTPGTILAPPTGVTGSVQVISFAEDNDGELYVMTREKQRGAPHKWRIYLMPCGDLCETTCLEQTPIAPEFSSLGCFKDVVENRALTLAASDCAVGEQAMSPQICVSFCATLGAAYAGVEFGFECFCGSASDDYSQYGELDAFSCSTLCKAFPDFQCGGGLTMEVFDIGEIPDPATPTPIALATPAPVGITTPPVSTATPSPVMGDTPAPATPGGLNSIGCFTDNQNSRIMGSVVLENSAMTPELCATTCTSAAFFGTQYGTQCFCGDGSSHDQYGESTACTFDCAGDTSIKCGGYDAMTVYRSDNVPAPTPAPGYLGCFADLKGDRIMTLTADTSDMTTAVCEIACAGSAFYGTQFGQQCFCGNAGTDYIKHGKSTSCNYVCTGDSDETCGGYDAMSVYSFAA